MEFGWPNASVQLPSNFDITSFIFEKITDSIIRRTLSFVAFLMIAVTSDRVSYWLATCVGKPHFLISL